MGANSERRMVLDEGKSVTNLAVASMPAAVGLLLIAYPWFGALEPSMVAPIMVPFGLVWLLGALCISSYHSELILDRETREVAYRSSLLLHSWANKVAQDNVKRVVLERSDAKYRFVLEVEKGEDLAVTTVDYWRSREWSEHVAAFLEVPLEDRCRDLGEVSPQELDRSIQEEITELTFPREIPGTIQFQWHQAGRATIGLPKRGMRSALGLRLCLGALFLFGAVAGFVAFPTVRWWALSAGLVVAAALSARPLNRATHYEELEVSPNGLVAVVTRLGRSRRVSISAHEIREITTLQGGDARFEHTDFDGHAVCIEGSDGHLQLGANLQRATEVEWLCQALMFILTQPRERILKESALHEGTSGQE